MNISALSIRTILGFVIAVMGLFAILLSLLTGSIHRDLIFDNHESMMKEVMVIAAKDRLNELNEILEGLSLSLQSTSKFKNALKTKNQSLLLNLLNNQFHQYYVTAGIIKLEQLIIFDSQFLITNKSNYASLIVDSSDKEVCPQLIKVAKLRKGYQRLKSLGGLCAYNNQPLYAAILPLGGLKLKGYIMVITDPTHNLKLLEKNLGLPVKLKSTNNEIVFQSSSWPTKETDSLISKYELKTATGVPVLSILTAHNIDELSKKIYKTQLESLLISVLGTLLIIVLSVIVMRRTIISPLTMLTNKLNDLQSDQANLGAQLELTGTKEMHKVVEGFNNMSSQLKKFHESLENMAHTDSLTGLYHHAYLLEQLDNEVSRARRHKRILSIMMFDIDHFKRVNDTYGHQVGDDVLREIAQVIQSAVRTHDTAARYGGEEFMLILPETGKDDAFILAERLRIKVASMRVMAGNEEIGVTISIGIASYHTNAGEITTRDLVQASDDAMYASKKGGRNRVTVVSL